MGRAGEPCAGRACRTDFSVLTTLGRLPRPPVYERAATHVSLYPCGYVTKWVHWSPWTWCCKRWRTRADGPCWRSFATIRPRPASSRMRSHRPPRVSRGTCGCCARPGWSTSGQTPSGGSTRLRPEALVEVDDWLEPYRALWRNRLDALHTEIARGKKAAEDEDHRHDASTGRDARGRPRRGRLRHRHRRPVGGLHDPERLARWIARGVRRPAGRRADPRRLHQHLDRAGDGSRSCEGRATCCSPWSPAPTTRAQLEAWLTPEGARPALVVEERGLPLDKLHFHGAGWQAHLEDLRRALEGRAATDRTWSEQAPEAGWRQRWTELTPEYQRMPVG